MIGIRGQDVAEGAASDRQVAETQLGKAREVPALGAVARVEVVVEEQERRQRRCEVLDPDRRPRPFPGGDEQGTEEPWSAAGSWPSSR